MTAGLSAEIGAPESGAPESGSAPVTPTARAAWRSSRAPALLLATLLVVSMGLALLSARGTTGHLDPASYEPEGSRALAALLRAEGVSVQEVRTFAEAEAAAGRNTTLLVTEPALVPDDALVRLAERHADTVLIAPGPPALKAFAPGLVPSGTGDVKRRAPKCGLPAAVAAGEARLGGVTYTVIATPTGRGSAAAALCYPTDDGATLARAETVTVLGSGEAFTNDRLDEDGNAALSLALLGEHRDLVWYRPSLGDPALRGGQKPLWSLIPDPVRFAILQLGFGVVLLALWRGRRLGPVVAEPLPVVVRAAEATEGRARLYRRAGARDRAADALRAAAVGRIAPRFGLGAASEPDAVTEAVARRTGRTTATLADLLYGSAPADDAALVALADALDELEREVRTP